MTTSVIFSCDRGGEWYACNTTTSKFVGCCSVNPCDVSCPAHALHPVSFDAQLSNTFPDFSCPASTNAYSCWGVPSKTFFGCCKSNPCQTDSVCPVGDLAPASADNDYLWSTFGDPNRNFVGAAPLLTGTQKRASGLVTLSGQHRIASKISYRNGLKVMGASIAILIVTSTIIVLWLCYRRFNLKSSNRSVSAKRYVRITGVLTKLTVDWEKSDYLPAPTKESTNVDAQSTCHDPGDYTIVRDVRRLGMKTISMLLVTTLVTLGVCGLLAFLWFADSRSTAWHQIMVNGWATRSVALSALVLRTAIDVQAAIATAILASILLESNGGLLLFQLASLSPMRAGTTSPWTLGRALFDPITHFPRQIRQHLHIQIMFVFLLLTTSILQFSSTILLSDLKIGPLVGHLGTSEVRTSISYVGEIEKIPRDFAWTTNPPQFPVFGEYVEEKDRAEDGSEDTGVLLRAFLPFDTTEDRQRLAYYKGNALVLDAGVSCQAPVLTQFSATAATSLNRQLTGLVTTSKEIVSLRNITATPFHCAVAWEGQISICQIGQPVGSFTGSLASQFTDSRTYGTAFLIIRAASSQGSEWLQVTTHGDGVIDKTSTQLSMSLCFAPWDAAILDVSFSGPANRTEPGLRYWKGFKTSEVLDYLMPGIKSSSRPVMSMEKPQSLLGDRPPPQRRPIVQSDMGRSSESVRGTVNPLPGNWTAFTGGVPLVSILDNFETAPSQVISADPALAAIFTDAINRSSVAWALSSLITVLSMTNYYGQQAAFDRLDDVQYSSFQDVLYPRDSLGFTIILLVLVAHYIVVGVLILLFVLSTRYTLLGNVWSAFAQVAESPDMRKYLIDTSTKTDAEVYQRMKDTKDIDMRARIVRRDGEAEVVAGQ